MEVHARGGESSALPHATIRLRTVRLRGHSEPTKGKNMVKRREIRNGKAKADEAMDGASQSEASAWTYAGGVQVAAAPVQVGICRTR